VADGMAASLGGWCAKGTRLLLIEKRRGGQRTQLDYLLKGVRTDRY